MSDAQMRLSRHATNRVRWISRRHPDVTGASVVENLPRSKTIGYDDRGNRRARLALGETELVVVLDEAAGVVITLWVE
jgi:hypothetical protein